MYAHLPSQCSPYRAGPWGEISVGAGSLILNYQTVQRPTWSVQWPMSNRTGSSGLDHRADHKGALQTRPPTLASCCRQQCPGAPPLHPPPCSRP